MVRVKNRVWKFTRFFTVVNYIFYYELPLIFNHLVAFGYINKNRFFVLNRHILLTMNFTTCLWFPTTVTDHVMPPSTKTPSK